MKSWLSVTILFLFLGQSVAQDLEITPSYGVQFGTKIDFGSNYLKIADSDQWGLNIGYEISSKTLLEVNYLHHNTELLVKHNIVAPTERRSSDLKGDWVHLGVMRYFSEDGVRPFVGGALGVVFLSVSNPNPDFIVRGGATRSEVALSFSFKAGINIMISEVVGINLQGNLLFPSGWGEVYVAAGKSVTVSGSSLVGGFSGGLVFRLNTGS